MGMNQPCSLSAAVPGAAGTGETPLSQTGGGDHSCFCLLIIPVLPSNCTTAVWSSITCSLHITSREAEFCHGRMEKVGSSSQPWGCPFPTDTTAPHKNSYHLHRSFPWRKEPFSLGDNFQLARKWTPEFLSSTLALPKVFENNFLPDYGEIILLLQEKEWREKRKHCNFPRYSSTNSTVIPNQCRGADSNNRC